MYKLSYVKFQSLLANRNYKLLKVYYITKDGKRNAVFLKCRIPGSNHYNVVIEVPRLYSMIFPLGSDIDSTEIFETTRDIDTDSLNYINLINKGGYETGEHGFVILNDNDMCMIRYEEKECYTFIDTTSVEGPIHEPVIELERELFNVKHKIEENITEAEVDDNERQFLMEDENKDTVLIFRDDDNEEQNKDIHATKMSIFMICIDIKTFYKSINKCVSIVLNYYMSIQENKTNLRAKRLEYINNTLETNAKLLFEKNTYVIEEEKKLKDQLPRLNNILMDCDNIKPGLADLNTINEIERVYKKTSDAIDEINNNIAVLNNEMEGLLNKYETCLKDMEISL